MATRVPVGSFYDMHMISKLPMFVMLLAAVASAAAQSITPNARPRASDLGLKVGILPTGPLDAITDVAGVEVGHTTIIRGDNIRTGVTAVLPHSGNLNRVKVPAAGKSFTPPGRRAWACRRNPYTNCWKGQLLRFTHSV